jgi:hypothetical protein
VLNNAYRTVPDAWETERYNLSAGWVSGVDLYKVKLPPTPLSPPLSPPVSTLNARWTSALIALDVSSPRPPNLGVPAFTSGDPGIDLCSDERFAEGAIQIVQEEGDLIVIPPRVWHQVYHLEPSIAVASQHMNDDNKMDVFNHILDWSSSFDRHSDDSGGRNHEILSYHSFASLTSAEQVVAVIRAALTMRNGEGEGEKLFRELMEQDVEASSGPTVD